MKFRALYLGQPVALGKPADWPTCPFCDARFFATSPVDEEKHEPATGDASVCSKCGAISVFVCEPHLHLRPPTNDELADAWKVLRGDRRQ